MTGLASPARPITDAPHPTPPAAGASSAVPSWADVLGPTWWLDVALLLLLVLCVGLLTPLEDPDLPMHLAVGEWVVRHREFPFVEPFAWTRPGAPYYAYSWLPQVTFYLVHLALGPLGLRLLQGALLAAAAGAGIWLGQEFRVRPTVCFALGGVNALVAILIAYALRPQIILLIALPVAWVLANRVAHRSRPATSAAGLLLTSAVVANSHLFFPILLAVAGLGVATRAPLRRTALVAGCVVAGWLLSPYALVWPDVFRQNFAANSLMTWPPAITELRPGFSYLVDAARQAAPPILPAIPILLVVTGLALFPWIGAAALERRERLVAGLYWLVGLIWFGYAVRLLMAWWLLVLPFAALGLGRRVQARAASGRPPSVWVKLPVVAGVLALVGFLTFEGVEDWRREGTVRTRRLATLVARPAEALVGWLEPRTRDGGGGRIFTIFNFGSYLTWRLPAYSASVDSRTLFPDSVTDAEAYRRAFTRDLELGPWRSAELAMVPVQRSVAAVLDTAAGWRRVATVVSEPQARDSVALWVREEWWRRQGRAPLPAADTVLILEPEKQP